MLAIGLSNRRWRKNEHSRATPSHPVNGILKVLFFGKDEELGRYGGIGWEGRGKQDPSNGSPYVFSAQGKTGSRGGRLKSMGMGEARLTGTLWGF